MGMGKGVCKRVVCGLAGAAVALLGFVAAAPAAQADSASVSGVPTMAAGVSTSFVIKDDSTLWAWGNNGYGQLGDGTRTARKSPVKVLSNVASIAYGEGHTLAVKKDGTLWGWGNNWGGQVGDRTKKNKLSPVQVTGMTGVVAVAAGWSHSLALKTDGTLWAWGCIDLHLFGGEDEFNSIPVKVMDGVISVAAAADQTLAIKTGGSLWAFGADNWGNITELPKELIASGVTAIAAGWTHSLAIKDDGSLWAWGLNNVGQLGDGTKTNSLVPKKIIDADVKAIAAYDDTSFAVLEDGTLLGWGKNHYGQLGDGTKTARVSPVEVKSGVTAVASGWAHTLAVDTDGMLWSWGYNSAGQLGDATTTARLKPVKIVQTGPGAVTSVKMLPATLYLVSGKSATLKVEVYPSSATLKDVTWKSANTGVVTVDAAGKVTAKKAAGKSTTVTVMSVDGKFTAKCKVYVVSKAKAVKTVKAPASNITGVAVGKTLQVKPTWTAKATGVVPTFASSDVSVAVIDKAGVITGVSAGKATITVKAGAKTKKFVFTVGDVAPTKITLDKKTASVKKGKQVTLQVKTWAPDNADPQTVVWKSSNKKVAKVNAAGVVTGKKKGTVTITATTWNGKKVTCKVTVK